MKAFLFRCLCLAIILHGMTLRSQDQALLTLSGATAWEELDEEELERLEGLRSAPVRINTASQARLLSCGLFSRFQVLSLLDYRAHSGDILSLHELGLIDGFSPETARMLAPFVSFYSAARAGALPKDRTQHEILGRWEGHNGLWGYAAKYRTAQEGRWMASVTARSSAKEALQVPDTWSFNGTFPFRKRPGKWMIGDYNARFGQGLALWNGFSLGGLTAAESFARHPSGLTPAWSLSPDGPLRGVAADLSFRQMTVSAAGIFPGLRARMDGDPKAAVSAAGALNVAWTGRRAEGSLTALLAPASSDMGSKIAADLRWTPGAVGFFAEGAWDLTSQSLAAVGGLIWSPAYQHKYALALRHYPARFHSALTGGIRAGSRCSGEQGLAAGIRLPWLRFSADYVRFTEKQQAQTKLLCILPLTIKERFSVTPRMQLRWKSGQRREDYRLEAGYSGSPWQAKVRTDVVRSAGTAWQCYAEGGVKSDAFTLYLRTGIFKVDHWDDRIYVYERDAPGCFNVPAYYGRGYRASLTGSVRWRRHKLYLRIAGIRYVSDKPGRCECRIQYNWSR